MEKEYLFQSKFTEQHRELLGWFTYPVFMIGFTFLYFWGLEKGFAIETWVIAVTVINFFVTLLLFKFLIHIMIRLRALNWLRSQGIYLRYRI